MGRHAIGSVIASAGIVALAIGFVVFSELETGSTIEPRSSFDASFSSTDGLIVGSAVQVSGIVVGSVTSIELDERTLLSHVRFEIQQDIPVPDDSRLMVQGATSGSAVLNLVCGRSKRLLRRGSTLVQTSPPDSLEADVGDYIFGGSALSDGK